MMPDRPPWFKCYPDKLLGAMAGLEPDEGYLYVTILLRIYETGGPIGDTITALARRTGCRSTAVQRSLESLKKLGKINQLDGGLIDSNTTHLNLQARAKALNDATIAGKESARKRVEKREQNQGMDSTTVQRPFNGGATEGQPSEDKKNIGNSSLRSELQPTRGISSSPKGSPLEILKTALSGKTSQDLIDHRKAKRAPLTPRAAELLVAAFRDHGDPERAAEAMIANGWQGFKPEWMHNAPTRAGPNGKSRVQNPFLASYLEDHGIGKNESCNDPRKTAITDTSGDQRGTAVGVSCDEHTEHGTKK